LARWAGFLCCRGGRTSVVDLAEAAILTFALQPLKLYFYYGHKPLQ